MPKKSQNSSGLNDFLIWIINQWVKCVFAFLPLNSSGKREKLAQKSVVARKKLGSRDQRPLHRKGAKSAKNFGRGEASLAPFKEYGCPAGQGTSVPCWIPPAERGIGCDFKGEPEFGAKH